MQESNVLLGQLSNPTQFATSVQQTLSGPNGLALTAAAFSDIIARGQSQQLAQAINQGFGQPSSAPIAAQTGAAATAGAPTPNPQVATAYGLAVLDQVRTL